MQVVLRNLSIVTPGGSIDWGFYLWRGDGCRVFPNNLGLIYISIYQGGHMVARRSQLTR